MLAKSVRTAFFIIGTLVIIGAVVVLVLTVMGKSPIQKFRNSTDDVDKKDALYTTNEFGDEVVNTDSLRDNVVDVSENGEVSPTDEFYESLKTLGFDDLNKATPELVSETSLQKTEDREKFVQSVNSSRESSNIWVIYTTSLSSESAFVYQTDAVTIVNQSNKTIEVKNLTTGNNYSLGTEEGASNISFVFDILGEFKFEVDGKPFSVFVTKPES